MQKGLTAGIAAAGADPSARQRTPLTRLRAAWPWAAIGIAAYLVTLIVTFPARFVVSAGPRWAVAGKVWDGEAVVDGAYRVQWRWAPLRSLANLAFAADVRVTGTGTDLAGSATLGPNSMLLEGLAGTGDAGLLAALGPRLPFACEAPLQINLKRLFVAGTRSDAAGDMRSAAGTCTPLGGGQAHALPALAIRIMPMPGGATRVDVADIARPRIPLFEGGIAAGRLRLALTPAGATTLPFAQGLVIDEAM